MTKTKYEAKRITDADKLPEAIAFGGEYSFRKSDGLATTLDRLFRTGCDVGGLAQQIDDNTIAVYPCYDEGHWTFFWSDPAGGLTQATRWVPAVG